MKLNVKTIAGAVGGVAVGFFLINSKNPFILAALGVAGGLVAHNFIKTKSDLIAEAESKSKENLKAIEDDINASLREKSNVEGAKFNPETGYIMPTGKVKEIKPKDLMDLTM